MLLYLPFFRIFFKYFLPNIFVQNFKHPNIWKISIFLNISKIYFFKSNITINFYFSILNSIQGKVMNTGMSLRFHNNHQLIDPSIHWSINLLIHQSIDSSIYWFINPLIHLFIDPLIHQSIDPSIHWSINPLIHQSIDPSIHWSINPMTYQSINLKIQSIPL